METFYRKIEENGQIRFEPVEETKENGLPKEWRLQIGKYYFFIDNNSDIIKCTEIRPKDFINYNLLPTKEHCEALISLMKLLTMAYEYNGNEWIKANGVNTYFTIKINYEKSCFEVAATDYNFPVLFKTHELATEFLKNFREDIEKAKMLL